MIKYYDFNGFAFYVFNQFSLFAFFLVFNYMKCMTFVLCWELWLFRWSWKATGGHQKDGNQNFIVLVEIAELQPEVPVEINRTLSGHSERNGISDFQVLAQRKLNSWPELSDTIFSCPKTYRSRTSSDSEMAWLGTFVVTKVNKSKRFDGFW